MNLETVANTVNVYLLSSSLLFTAVSGTYDIFQTVINFYKKLKLKMIIKLMMIMITDTINS